MGRRQSGGPSLITEKRKRIRTFQKRKKGLEKKAYELATLCDVNISMIMFGPDDELEVPSIWPEDPTVTTRMINLYQKNQTTDPNCSRNADIASIYKDWGRLVGKEVDKLKKQSIKEKYPTWDKFYESLPYDQLMQFGNELGNVLQGLQSKIDSIQNRQMCEAVSSQNQVQLQGLNSTNGFKNTHQMFQAVSSYNQFQISNNPFNCFGNEEALFFPNSQRMKTMDESSSHSQNYINYNLPPLPGIQDNFVQNNVVINQPEPHYLCYATQQVQMPISTPWPLASIDPYEDLGGNFNFQY